MEKKLSKQEALDKIEELKRYVADEEKTQIGFQIKTYLGEVLFTSTKTTQREAILEAVEQEANLRGANLCEANLCGANLCEANLCGVDLRGADLCEANLRGANLREADLRGANLRGAELENAKFYGKGGTKPLKRSQLPDFLKALGFIIEE